MVEQIVALCKQMGAGEEQEALLQPLAYAAGEELRRRLRSGVEPEDCGEVFALAAAMVVLDSLEEVTGENRVTSFTAGEVTIRRDGPGGLTRQARRLLAPWMGESGFAFQGVVG